MRKCWTCGGEFDAFFDNSNHECMYCYWDRYTFDLGYPDREAFFAAEAAEYLRSHGVDMPERALGGL